MSKKLVIVESPAKAKTIAGYLGSDYEVEASIGHIRDLPLNGKSLPEAIRKEWWADYAVNVDEGFEPIYEVPAEKKAQVQKLRAAMKGKDTLVLATDEDREGESISWHLLQVLKPAKGVDVKRIAFHEITKEAIHAALRNPRDLDDGLVEAQEARRILDRLYGYALSPVLWTKIGGALSAGRVQSPAVKLIVERELQRRDFRRAGYWDLKATLKAEDGTFEAELRTLDGQRVANGKDFDPHTGALKDDRALLLSEADAAALADGARTARPWTVSKLETEEGREKPPPPFMTTTLQQEANRKLRFSADRTMRVAQTLYEGVEMGGERVGLITYMRTDSLTLSQTALDQTRAAIEKLYGANYLPDKPVRYASKVRNAQEAHEAIRPTDALRRPEDVSRHLNEDQRKLYELIWKRTVACQMAQARVLRTSVEVKVDAGGKDLRFAARGRQILFDGFLRAYVEGSDDPEAELEGTERRLPALAQGMELEPVDVGAAGHETRPPSRYTDASLIKKLEELGIGRPSTYASIISVIVDRGYVRKSGRELIPSFKAFLTVHLLDENFGEFMELGFTAQMDESLDEIAGGRLDSKKYLGEFFFGTDAHPGLKPAVDERKRAIPFPVYEIGRHPELDVPIVVRIGKDGGAFLQVETESGKKYANVPEDLAPADLTVDKALELFEQKAGAPIEMGTHPDTGKKLFLKQGRDGFYIEVERDPVPAAPAEGAPKKGRKKTDEKAKPVWISVPRGIDPRELPREELDALCRLPRKIGDHPETGEPVIFRLGKFGPYVQCGAEIRNVEDWRKGLTMSLNEALEVLAQPKFAKRGAPAALKEFGALEGASGPVKVLSGRFGPYVTDGTINATLPKTMDPESVTAEAALELLQKKAAAGPSTKRFGRKKAGRKPAKKK
ncbi:MAG: type I DNA topoisomerase [Fimbriimonadaceae bacterium]|nr:type I DNA topoisomerase [Chthonomonadaceae bacterium]MCO5298007.1 type I DNA topoisomerase [Fimbriimonadaceae bacterium]